MKKSENCDGWVGTWYCADCDDRECRCSGCDYLHQDSHGTWLCLFYRGLKEVTEIERCDEWRITKD